MGQKSQFTHRYRVIKYGFLNLKKLSQMHYLDIYLSIFIKEAVMKNIFTSHFIARSPVEQTEKNIDNMCSEQLIQTSSIYE